jgi:hypothetical protein
VALEHELQRRFFRTYVKKTNDQTFVVRAALFDARNQAGPKPLLSFPRFWKEAWENGDFIYFSGHSGDGQALKLKTMLDALDSADIDKIRFKSGKTQIAVFDSCSSYAHYQDAYASLKGAGLHLVTVGLVSLYHLADATVDGFLSAVLGTEGRNRPWLEVLGAVEQSQLAPHVRLLYPADEREQAMRKYLRKHQYPSSLMNVLVVAE